MSTPDPTEIGGRLDRASAAAALPGATGPERVRRSARSAAMIGLAGPVLTDDEADLLRRLRPVGVYLFRRNIGERAAIRTLTDAIRAAAGVDTRIAVDQEGGRVARLRPPDFIAHPPAAAIATERAAWLTGALIGLEAAGVGIDMVAAPVLDLAIDGADAVIGDRAFRGGPADVAALAAAMAAGLGAAGVHPVGKHIPGHGRAEADSHLALPELDDVDTADLAPFVANRSLPWMMTAHIRYRAIDPVAPATVSAKVIGDIVRRRIGYAGALITDDLGMHALSGAPAEKAAAAIAAGCDIALHCSGILAESEAVCIAAGEVGGETLTRLDAARRWVDVRRRTGLDAAALLAERDALVGARA